MVGTVRNHAVFQNGLRVKSAMKAGSVLLYWMEMFITLECVIIMEDAWFFKMPTLWNVKICQQYKNIKLIQITIQKFLCY